MKGFASPAEEAKTMMDRVRAILFKGTVEDGRLPYEALKVFINFVHITVISCI
jgi:hypothetical protein